MKERARPGSTPGPRMTIFTLTRWNKQGYTSTNSPLDELTKLTENEGVAPMTKRKMPTQVTSDYWIWASRRDKSYPEATDRCGKWMVMVYTSEVDQVWTVIRDAVEQNKLGSSAKVATMKPNENASNPDVKVICIYTYDSDDRDDLLRVLTALREIGIMHRAYYKEDNETLSGNYSFNTKRAVSKYWADYGKIELRVPKRR